jgi:2-methylaconitate cis-trans-isomerase PrpF
MGLAKSAATPKICVVAPPTVFTALDGQAYPADQTDAVARVISMGNCHRAFALTLRKNGAPCAEQVTVYRSARRLMEGFVRVP